MLKELSNLPPEEQLRRLLLQEEQERLDRLEARIGTDDALKRSMTPVIADVLRDAGVRDHRRLAGAMAPVVVQSMKAEIRNSRDMMVDALYPITGRLVAAAVRNAFKDLVDQLNEKLESGLSARRWHAWLKARMTGRSEAEILLSEGAAFEIINLMMIDRQTGLLIAQVAPPAEESSVDSELLSGVLTAIMAFVRDAKLGAKEQELRTLDVGDIRLHLQVSASVILAVKTKGPPPPRFESALSEMFCAFLARWGQLLPDIDDAPSHERAELSDDLDKHLETLLSAKRRNFKKPSRKGTILLLLLALLLCGWLGWRGYQAWQAGQIEARATAVIEAQPVLVGYPITATYDRSRNAVAVDGLVPDGETLARLRQALAVALPTTNVALRLNTLPAAADIEPLIGRLDTLEGALVGLKGATAEQRQATERLLQTSEQQSQTTERALASLEQQGRASVQTFEASQAQLGGRLVVDIGRLQGAIAAIDARLLPVDEQALIQLDRWLDRQAILFGDDADFADPRAAEPVLQQLALRLAGAPPNARVRIVGYADDSGNERTNERVSEQRAARVRQRLIDLGVTSDRVTAIGRSSEARVSAAVGAASPNRRVEFELFGDDGAR